MKHAILQILIIDDVIKIEFKITTADGFSKLIEKIIKTEADYEAFKKDIRFGVKTMDSIIKQAIKSEGNEQTGNNTGDMQPVKHHATTV